MVRGNFLWLALLAALASAQSPDRAPLVDEWGYRPVEGERVAVNPPALSWVHEKDAAGYTVEWAREASFKAPVTVRGIPWSVYVHHAPLAAGRYFWRYRIETKDGQGSAWSRARSFIVDQRAIAFPQPPLDELRRRIGAAHPRLFVRASDVERLREWTHGQGKPVFDALIARADALLTAAPTPEPAVRANPYDEATRQYWWSNRLQTLKALQEGEVLAFVWLVTRDAKYKEPARKRALELAAWDPDGPTNFTVNCEAAKPMLHRLARIYDWAFDALSESDRARMRAVMSRRARDAWMSGEVKQGVGHLNQPYGSHANRTWHKMAEYAVATLGEAPEADQLLAYAVTKFFAVYPVWSDDDGGWHEGLSYFGGYMSKAAWWMELARTPLGIDGFTKPFFAQFGDYAMYSSPPGSPELGLGDLAHRPVSSNWSFMHYYVRRTKNPHWAWWVEQWKIPATTEDIVWDFLCGAAPAVEPKAPAGLPSSKVFRGTGVAILNTDLTSAASNVQVRFKSSPMGRWSHGHDPHNSFTLNAYGEALLVNNVYRDLYGTPFHKDWVWSTRSQNAVLVDGAGQKPHSADLGGRIVEANLGDGLDYVVGDAAASYEGKPTAARRHVIFLKPDVVVLADELRAPRPSTYQWMLHAQKPFEMREQEQRLVVEREHGGVVVDYVADGRLRMKQWTGYDPPPDQKYLDASKFAAIPPQWHVEASSQEPAPQAFTVTVLRVYRRGQPPKGAVQVTRRGNALGIRAASSTAGEFRISFRRAADATSAVVQRGKRTWRLKTRW
jgi:hypothetical protein